MAKKVTKAQYKELTAGNIFGTLRILVIGRPEAGKSTLIRLILGLSEKKGPGSGSRSKPDINKEWSHPNLPVKIHECDVDLSPQEQEDPNAPKLSLVQRVIRHARLGDHHDLADVKKFLKARMKNSDFSERVHLVWYVMSAMDEQNGSNTKVLTEIGIYEDIPILLIVTHNDQDVDGGGYNRNVEAHLAELLEQVENRESVISNIVKVANDVPKNIDDNALTLVSIKTREHLDSEEMKAAWGAAQTVDFDEKIRLSAREIVGYKEAAIWASPAGLIPGPHQTIVGSLLTGLCRALCRIWGVPKHFKKSLKQNLASDEVYKKQLSLLLEKFSDLGKGAAAGLGPLAGLATRFATPVATRVMGTAVMTSISETLSLSITPVALAAAAVGWVYASRNDAYNSMLAMVSLGVMVTGAILYVKATYDRHGWNENRSKKEYDKFIQEFVTQHGPDLKQDIGEHHAVSDIFNPERDRGQVIKQLVTYFDRLNSQHSVQDGTHYHEAITDVQDGTHYEAITDFQDGTHHHEAL